MYCHPDGPGFYERAGGISRAALHPLTKLRL